MNLTEIGQWSVITWFEASALMVSGQDHTIFYRARINYIRARAD